MNRDVYEAVAERANGRCECCAQPFLSAFAFQPELDHFWGRARAESVESCWLLHRQCHKQKTNWVGGRSIWLRRFAAHCAQHGYRAEEKRAQREYEWAEAKRGAA